MDPFKKSQTFQVDSRLFVGDEVNAVVKTYAFLKLDLAHRVVYRLNAFQIQIFNDTLKTKLSFTR